MTIKEASEKFGISIHAIRFYEKEKLFTAPRNDKGVRIFNEKSLRAIEAIVHYRNVGMTLGDIKQVFNNFTDHELSLKLLKETKKELDLKITELESTREYLIYKIGLHEKLARGEKV